MAQGASPLPPAPLPAADPPPYAAAAPVAMPTPPVPYPQTTLPPPIPPPSPADPFLLLDPTGPAQPDPASPPTRRNRRQIPRSSTAQQSLVIILIATGVLAVAGLIVGISLSTTEEAIDQRGQQLYRFRDQTPAVAPTSAPQARPQPPVAQPNPGGPAAAQPPVRPGTGTPSAADTSRPPPGASAATGGGRCDHLFEIVQGTDDAARIPIAADPLGGMVRGVIRYKGDQLLLRARVRLQVFNAAGAQLAMDPRGSTWDESTFSFRDAPHDPASATGRAGWSELAHLATQDLHLIGPGDEVPITLYWIGAAPSDISRHQLVFFNAVPDTQNRVAIPVRFGQLWNRGNDAADLEVRMSVQNPHERELTNLRIVADLVGADGRWLDSSWTNQVVDVRQLREPLSTSGMLRTLAARASADTAIPFRGIRPPGEQHPWRAYRFTDVDQSRIRLRAYATLEGPG